MRTTEKRDGRGGWLRGLCRGAFTFMVLVTWGLTFFAFRTRPHAQPRETVSFPEGWVLAPFVLVQRQLVVLQDAKSEELGTPPRKLLVWDLNTRRTITELDNLTAPVRCLALSPDRETVATVAQDEVVRLWDRATAREIRSLRVPGRQLEHVAFAPDGKSVLATWGSGARRWNLSDGQELTTIRIQVGHPVGIRFRADGQAMLVVGNNSPGRMEFWNLARGTGSTWWTCRRVPGYFGLP